LTDYFEPGDHILLREVWRGRVWTARAVIVVEDSPQLIALCIVRGSVWKRPFDSAGMPKRIPADDWILRDEFWTADVLRISVPAGRFSILPFHTDRGHFRFWYLNIETPLQRTRLGFDYMDQTLDIIISPELSEWRWKDEEELSQAVAQGLYTQDHAADIRDAGEQALACFLGRKPPFDRRWEDWRPPPEWPVPVLPAGWDIVGE
jgi:hypothetical protein